MPTWRKVLVLAILHVECRLQIISDVRNLQDKSFSKTQTDKRLIFLMRGNKIVIG